LCSITSHPTRIPAPRLVLWAWERPEDLRFIDPATTGVAYLAATIGIQTDGSLRFHFRQQPLRLPAERTSQIAVVRIETPAHYVLPDPAGMVHGLSRIVQREDLAALQIDFDARASERAFYRAILAGLRERTSLPISITALASWCDSDWQAGSPELSEAVPMFFRMGNRERKDMSIRASACRGSIGLSTDEKWPAHRPAGLLNPSRVYVFNPHPWTKPDYDATVRQLDEWK
jgi:hypothetical protein